MPLAAGCAAVGSDGPPDHAPGRAKALPVRAEARPGHAPAGRLDRAPVRADPTRRGNERRGDRRGRLRGEPADAARSRAVRPRRPAAGHAGRRRQRRPARNRGRGSDRLPGPGLGLALPQPAARSGPRCARRPRREPDLRRVPLRGGHRRRDRPRRRAGVAAGRPRHPDRCAPAGARLDALVPAAAGVVPAVRRPGDRGDRRRGRHSGRRRPRRARGDGRRVQRGGLGRSIHRCGGRPDG